MLHTHFLTLVLSRHHTPYTLPSLSRKTPFHPFHPTRRVHHPTLTKSHIQNPVLHGPSSGSPKPQHSLTPPSSQIHPLFAPTNTSVRVHPFSGGSSIASTRSSAAYTSSGSALASGDYGNNVQLASNDDDQAIGVSITLDNVVHLANQDSSVSTSVSHLRALIDQSRWSQSYGGVRSRSSSRA
jgi:hypothetical protein